MFIVFSAQSDIKLKVKLVFLFFFVKKIVNVFILYFKFGLVNARLVMAPWEITWWRLQRFFIPQGVETIKRVGWQLKMITTGFIRALFWRLFVELWLPGSSISMIMKCATSASILEGGDWILHYFKISPIILEWDATWTNKE